MPESFGAEAEQRTGVAEGQWGLQEEEGRASSPSSAPFTGTLALPAEAVLQCEGRRAGSDRAREDPARTPSPSPGAPSQPVPWGPRVGECLGRLLWW